MIEQARLEVARTEMSANVDVAERCAGQMALILLALEEKASSASIGLVAALRGELLAMNRHLAKIAPAQLYDIISDAHEATQNKLSRLTARNPMSAEVRARVHALTGGKCFYCAHELTLSRAETACVVGRRLMHVDHLVPKSCGGPDHESNFVPACEPCNILKGDRAYIEFIRDRHPHLRVATKDGVADA